MFILPIYNIILYIRTMKLYSLLYNFFDCLSCKTLPNADVDILPIYGYDSDEEETKEIKQWPYQFFMVTRY